MSIKGKQKENTGNYEQELVTGIYEAEIVAVNPTEEQFKSILGIELSEDSKATDYLGESKEGNTTLRIDFWLKNFRNQEDSLRKITFFLENTPKENKDGSKQQFINNIGNTAWASDEDSLKELASPSNSKEGYRKMMASFIKREFRQAYIGEEDLYNFLKYWLGALDYQDADTEILLDWKKLMKGNVKDLKDQLNGEYVTTVGVLAYINIKEKENENGETEIKSYQAIYNKSFVYPNLIKNFRLIDYKNEKIIEQLKTKLNKDLKNHERFVLNVVGEYGCKGYYTLMDLIPYDATKNIISSSETLIENDDY